MRRLFDALNVIFYVLIGFFFAIILFSSRLLIVDETTIWMVLNNLILSITALVLLWYTFETYRIRIKTTKGSRPLLISGDDLLDGFVDISSAGTDAKKPEVSLSIKNIGSERAFIKSVQVKYFFLPIRFFKVGSLTFTSIIDPDELGRIEFTYYGELEDVEATPGFAKHTGWINRLPLRWKIPQGMKLRTVIRYIDLAGVSYYLDLKGRVGKKYKI